MILSFDKGEKKIAYVQGGKFDKKVIRIYEIEDKTEESESEEEINDIQENEYKPQYIIPPEYYQTPEYQQLQPDIQYEDPDDYLGLIGEDFYRKKKKYLRVPELDQIKQSIIQNIPPKNPSLHKIYKEAKVELKNKSKREFQSNDGFIKVYPNPKSERIFVAGATGSGKSSWAAEYIKVYKKLYPFNKVYLFSRIDEDPVLDKLKGIKRYEIDQDLIDDPPDATKEFKNSLIIFDDIDTMTDKKLKEAVIKLRNDILQCCRKFNTSLISTSHQLMNYKSTRDLLNDSELITFFPKSGSTYHIIRFLKLYCGLNKPQIDRILSLNSRSVTVHKAYPLYIISDHELYLL